jgi:tRNA (guanine-N7-)-methyltransferase
MRLRQHVNPLGIGFVDLRTAPPQLPAGRSVELEVGCAEADFLFERAAHRPDGHYLGLDVRAGMVELVNRRAAAVGAPVQAVFGNANLHLRRLLPAGRVARVFLNFPDPWFKMRHRKRRMIDEALVRDIHGCCISGAEVFVQTDVWSIAIDGMGVFDRLDELYENLAGAWSFWKQGNPFAARSGRERACEREGKPIWRMLYRVR